jgi:alanyl-tRNA synthetase
MTAELAKEKSVSFNPKEAYAFLVKHQELSRSTSAGMFKSGLADNSEQTTRLHTATHILNEALRKVLGSDVKQRGSNITPERLRFDFNFSRKVTEEELKKIESLVNDKIKEHLPVTSEEITFDQAVKEGAQAEFGHKYPERVSVYTIGPKKSWFSKEICTGPHVKNTQDIGHFKIIKEEGVAAGIRRIKAIVN